MKKFFKNVALVATMLFAGVVAYAQMTTSAVNGRIVDQSGEPLAGAVVLLNHTPSGSQYYAVANGDGRYTIEGVRPGSDFTIEVSFLGCQTVKYTGVTLNLGETYKQDVTLTSGEQLAEAVLVVNASKFTTEKTGASTNISSRQMTSMPMINRSISDVAKLSPYANGMSFAGGDGRSTNFTVDGSNFNNNFGLSDKLPGGGNPISLDAIDELQVVVAPFDVRQTNFIGGGINAITKSGTNTFKGSVYSYFQNQDLRGNKINGKDLGDRAKESKTVYGFTLGGPIIKNKLFFFVNYETTTQPGQVIKYRANKGGEANKGNVSRTTLDDLKTVQEYMKTKYGYDTGSYTDFPGDESNDKLLARIDWNVAKGHRVSLRYNYTKNTAWNAPNGNSSDTGYRLNGTYRVGNESMAFANNMYSMDNTVSSISFDYNAKINEKISNQLLVTYSNIEDIRGSNSSAFPHVDIIKKNSEGVWQPYMSLGYELFTWNNGVHNKVWTVKDDVTYLMGNHKFVAGFNYEHQFANNAYMRNGAGYYRYAWTDEATITDVLNGTPESFAVTYGWNGELNPNAQVTFNQIGIYLQDEWNVNDQLKLTYGVRFDDLIFDESDIATNKKIAEYTFRDGLTIDTGKWPNNRVQVSPRVGFVYDVKGDNTLKFRGGTGLFQGRLPLVYFTNTPTNAGLVQNSVQYKSTWTSGELTAINAKLHAFDGGMITDVNEMIEKLGLQKELTDANHVAGSTMSGVDPNFKMPQIWKTSFAVDYQVPASFPLTVTAEGIFNKTIYGVVVDNINIADQSDATKFSKFSGVDDRLIYSGKGLINAGKNAPYLTNTTEGYGYIGNITVNAEPLKGLNVMAAYTHTESKEISGLPGSDPLSTWQGLYTVNGPNFATLQRSQYVVPDKLIASVDYNFPVLNGQFGYAMDFGLFYTGMTSSGYSYCYSNDMNGDGINNDLMYIYPKGSDINWKDATTAAASAKAYDAFVAQDKYLRTHKGQYAEAYAARAPWVNRFDFRWAHNFTFKAGKQVHLLQFTIDLLNAGNLINSKWGVYKNSAICNNSRILKYEGQDATTKEPTFSMATEATTSYDYIVNSSQCWQLQFGLRYKFN
ncbi:MAG: TonB-dependent receptor [Bacteroidales bacterium]|nr:TonB-dependent receptor [Bacteroidales bacterium]